MHMNLWVADKPQKGSIMPGRVQQAGGLEGKREVQQAERV